MLKKILGSLIVILVSQSLYGQKLNGIVLNTAKTPLIGVTVYWLSDPSSGVFTDENGSFEISQSAKSEFIVASMVGMLSDTIAIDPGLDTTTIVLNEDTQTLNQVVVEGKSSFLDKASIKNVEVITAKGLTKAACCNLSEAFETNASVSVAVNDAVTGAKQLRLIGMAGKYLQTNFENLPNVRGLATTFGLGYTPGTWIQSIDIIKGTGSVVNGYESLTGGVNVEYHKPQLMDKLYINTYVNSLGRLEGNINYAQKVNDELSTAVLSHYSMLKSSIDRNGDTFMDTPQYDQVNVLNRWNYRSERIHAQWGLRYLQEDRLGGQIQEGNTDAYQFGSDTRRLEAFSKTGFLFPDTPYRGLALIAHASVHSTDNKIGQRNYSGKQNSFYANLIYQDIIGTTIHTYKTGLSFLNDSYREEFDVFKANRDEVVPGVFFEYTYKPIESTSLVIGLRNDFHNLFGNQLSPRLHFRQEVTENIVWRLSGGKGFRVPNYWAESFGYLVSNKEVQLLSQLKPEILWNFGSSVSIDLNPKTSLLLDAFHSRFMRQQMYDLMDPRYLRVYNSEEKSYVSSLQAELKWEPIAKWDLNLAYRFIDNKQTFRSLNGSSSLLDAPFVSNHTVHFNTGYSLPYDKWKFDLTIHYNGAQQIPLNLEEVRSSSEFPFKRVDGFFNINFQINRNFRKWEYYLGGENILNFQQPNPVIGFDRPSGDNFDAGLVYAPVVGRIIYFGSRFKIQ